MDANFFDYNNDGYLDILIVGEIKDSIKNSTGLHLYYNNRKGHFINATELIPGIGGSFKQVEFSDFDDDGDMDLFLTTTMAL